MAAPSMGVASAQKQHYAAQYVLVTPSRNEAAFIEKTPGVRGSTDGSAGEMGDRE